ncbi:MAG: hypothetical protein HXY43_26275 [Fischerella sp.]|uniref:hypothetical protein n=1 Tax=Fischerella sp. TaxID=1191 RepID=UPI0018364611|nr:hypothetical protein [Fischerella sp.]NWF62642.1 hypothetical protein [Fischerella sp.]
MNRIFSGYSNTVINNYISQLIIIDVKCLAELTCQAIIYYKIINHKRRVASRSITILENG